jgi:hypothetical protein
LDNTCQGYDYQDEGVKAEEGVGGDDLILLIIRVLGWLPDKLFLPIELGSFKLINHVLIGSLVIRGCGGGRLVCGWPALHCGGGLLMPGIFVVVEGGI